jgi:hypothetical protein
MARMSILFFLFTTIFLPLLLHKTIESIRMEWIKNWLPEIWTVVFAGYLTYIVFVSSYSEAILRVRGKWGLSSGWGYVIAAALGASIFAGYWWLTGKMFSGSSHKADVSSLNHETPAGTQRGAVPSTLSPPEHRTPAEIPTPPITKTDKFGVIVPFNSANRNVPIPLDINSDDPNRELYSDWGSIAGRPEHQRDGTPWPDQRDFSNEESRALFIGKLLQFYIFCSIDNLQRDSEGIRWTSATGSQTTYMSVSFLLKPRSTR